MIIKKRKNSDNNENANNVPQQAQAIPKSKPEKQEEVLFDVMATASERQERRRGDRRRGYRRIEDRSLVSRAQEEAKLIKEQAAQEGFQNGLEKANSEISALQQAIASILEIKTDAYNYYKKDIADIAIEVARKILNTQVKIDPETIVEIAESVIKEVSQEENKITFIINPADALVLCESLENNSAFNNKRATMSVQTNENIEQGSCKVVTSSGNIDATFSSQLSIIKKAFEEGI